MKMKTKGFRPHKTITERLKLMKNDSFHQSMIDFYMSESDMTLEEATFLQLQMSLSVDWAVQEVVKKYGVAESKGK
ncbi:MAG: hypothetical protein HXO06_00590 [Prevotella salivae]|uniref:hypothetical protein n=1 Tax=Segatella salivae TaxID=228604 RepID=UPI001CB1A692|nr:hypothetical protein [Segatella salivae]MBF1543674.1 hypothetical protein [Segatella salivae]